MGGGDIKQSSCHSEHMEEADLALWDLPGTENTPEDCLEERAQGLSWGVGES